MLVYYLVVQGIALVTALQSCFHLKKLCVRNERCSRALTQFETVCGSLTGTCQATNVTACHELLYEVHNGEVFEKRPEHDCWCYQPLGSLFDCETFRQTIFHHPCISRLRDLHHETNILHQRLLPAAPPSSPDVQTIAAGLINVTSARKSSVSPSTKLLLSKSTESDGATVILHSRTTRSPTRLHHIRHWKNKLQELRPVFERPGAERLTCTHALYSVCLKHHACRQLWEIFKESCKVDASNQCRMRQREHCWQSYEGLTWTGLGNCTCADDNSDCHFIRLQTSFNKCIWVLQNERYAATTTTRPRVDYGRRTTPTRRRQYTTRRRQPATTSPPRSWRPASMTVRLIPDTSTPPAVTESPRRRTPWRPLPPPDPTPDASSAFISLIRSPDVTLTAVEPRNKKITLTPTGPRVVTLQPLAPPATIPPPPPSNTFASIENEEPFDDFDDNFDDFLVPTLPPFNWPDDYFEPSVTLPPEDDAWKDGGDTLDDVLTGSDNWQPAVFPGGFNVVVRTKPHSTLKTVSGGKNELPFEQLDRFAVTEPNDFDHLWPQTDADFEPALPTEPEKWFKVVAKSTPDVEDMVDPSATPLPIYDFYDHSTPMSTAATITFPDVPITKTTTAYPLPPLPMPAENTLWSLPWPDLDDLDLDPPLLPPESFRYSNSGRNTWRNNRNGDDGDRGRNDDRRRTMPTAAAYSQNRYEPTVAPVRQAQFKPSYESTCSRAFRYCNGTATCAWQLSHLEARCSDTRYCDREQCSRAIKEFVATVEINLVQDMTFCRCQPADRECSDLQRIMFPNCLYKVAGAPKSCTDMVSSCGRDPECSRWNDYYFRACSVQNGVCESRHLQQCRQSILAVRGTELESPCYCSAADRECVELRSKLLPKNPCVEEAMARYTSQYKPNPTPPTDPNRPRVGGGATRREGQHPSRHNKTPAPTSAVSASGRRPNTGTTVAGEHGYPGNNNNAGKESVTPRPGGEVKGTTKTWRRPSNRTPKETDGPPTQMTTPPPSQTCRSKDITGRMFIHYHNDTIMRQKRSSPLDNNNQQTDIDELCYQWCLCDTDNILTCSKLPCFHPAKCKAPLTTVEYGGRLFIKDRGSCTCGNGTFICDRDGNIPILEPGVHVLIGYSQQEARFLRDNIPPKELAAAGYLKDPELMSEYIQNRLNIAFKRLQPLVLHSTFYLFKVEKINANCKLRIKQESKENILMYVEQYTVLNGSKYADWHTGGPEKICIKWLRELEKDFDMKGQISRQLLLFLIKQFRVLDTLSSPNDAASPMTSQWTIVLTLIVTLLVNVCQTSLHMSPFLVSTRL